MQGTIFRAMDCLEVKEPWNYSLWLTFAGAGECSLQWPHCEADESQVSEGSDMGQEGRVSSARFVGRVICVASPGPMLWNSQHCHVEIVYKCWAKGSRSALGPENFTSARETLHGIWVLEPDRLELKYWNFLGLTTLRCPYVQYWDNDAMTLSALTWGVLTIAVQHLGMLKGW